MKTIWSGTVDNRELAGLVNCDKQPMRVVEDADGRLMKEFASQTEYDCEITYGDDWYADSAIRFRDMEPAPSAELVTRMVAANLIES